MDDIGTKLLILLGLLFGLILGIALTWATRQPDINKLQLQIDTITSDIQNLEKKNKDLLSDKQSLENQLAEIQSKIIPSPPQSPEMVQLQADNERLKVEQAQLSQELAATTQKLLGAQKELSDLQQRYQAQIVENKSLQAQIQQLNQELGKAKNDYSQLEHDFDVYKIQHPTLPPSAPPKITSPPVEPTTAQTCIDTDGNQPVLEGATVFGANLREETQTFTFSNFVTGASATGFLLLNESKSELFLQLTYASTSSI